MNDGDPKAEDRADESEKAALRADLIRLRQEDPATFAALMAQMEFEELQEDPEFLGTLEADHLDREEYVSAAPGPEFGPED